MPRFAANLTMLWPDLDVYDRFRAAAEAGFRRVEILFVHALEIHVEDLGVRFARHAEGGVERARRLGQIVDVARFARDVQIRAVVRQ